MVAVFGGFASGDLVFFQQMGFGLAMAIILDATIVRLVLVPAAMELLGDRNWYFPSWLEWLPSIQIEGRVDSWSFRSMLPLAICSSPIIHRSNVLLPDPDGPIITRRSFRLILRSKPSKTTSGPKFFSSPSIVTNESCGFF